ncbi:MAG TPA: helix-turn-helix domain-containing protein [Verrucomicrobiae bacterium]|nr:helix-turn-helix domain-containing protein [Verrucomicrobiae bacterium]
MARWSTSQDVKREAAATDDPMVVTLGSGPFALRVRPHGWRRYPIWASSPELELFLGAPTGFPPAFAQCYAVYLHGAGAGVALATVTDWLTTQLFAHVPPALAVSPIDVYADGEGWVPTHQDLERLTCRATARRAFVTVDPASVHHKGVQCSGFTFGKGAITAKVYDKSTECRLRGETWLATEWTARTGDGPVWRVEFAFRRAALRELGIQTPHEAVERRQDLWTYGLDWLTLRVPTRDATRARWPEAPEWQVLRTARLGVAGEPLVREAARGADLGRLVQGLVVYATSVAATRGRARLGAGRPRSRAVPPTAGPHLPRTRRPQAGRADQAGGGRAAGGVGMNEERLAPLLVDVREAARLLGCGRTLVYDLIGRGELPVIKLGRLTRIPVAALAVLVDQDRSPVVRPWGVRQGYTPPRTPLEVGPRSPCNDAESGLVRGR